MHRRHLLTLSLMATLPLGAARAQPVVSEIRVGAAPAVAARMQRRLGIPVRSETTDLVRRIDAGHLEAALLTRTELAEAMHRMGNRIVVLPGAAPGATAALTPVTRRVLPAALRVELAAALA